jgi:hypothetical protein
MGSCLYGIHDDRNPNDDGNAIFPVSRSAYGPQVWAGDPFQASPYGRIAVPFNGVVIYIDDVGTGHLVAYTTPADFPTTPPTFTSVNVFDFATSFNSPVVLSAVAFDGSAWFIVGEDATSYNELWQWTGGATATLVLGSGDIPNANYVNLATDGNDLYYAYQSAADGQAIVKRNGGTWDELTLPAGAGTNWTPVGWNGVSKPPYVYFAGFDADVADASKVMITLQVLDETVTVLNNTVPTWSGAVSTFGVLAEMGGALYIVGPVSNGTNSYRLYKITGSGVPSSVANLTTLLGVGATVQPTLLLLYTWRNQLYGSLPTVTSTIFASCADGDPTTWATLASDSATVSNIDGSPIFSA